jgi:hypothetical protein
VMVALDRWSGNRAVGNQVDSGSPCDEVIRVRFSIISANAGIERLPRYENGAEILDRRQSRHEYAEWDGLSRLARQHFKSSSRSGQSVSEIRMTFCIAKRRESSGTVLLFLEKDRSAGQSVTYSFYRR